MAHTASSGCPSPINNLEKRAYETPVREVLQGSGGNNTAELWIPFSPPLATMKAWWLSVICSGSNVCVCVCACVRACACAWQWAMPSRRGQRVSATFPGAADRYVVKIQNLYFWLTFCSVSVVLPTAVAVKMKPSVNAGVWKGSAHASAVSSHLKFLSAATQVGIA